MMRQAGFVDVEFGSQVDPFAGAGGEANARAFGVLGYVFLGFKPA